MFHYLLVPYLFYKLFYLLLILFRLFYYGCFKRFKLLFYSLLMSFYFLLKIYNTLRRLSYFFLKKLSLSSNSCFKLYDSCILFSLLNVYCVNFRTHYVYCLLPYKFCYLLMGLVHKCYFLHLFYHFRLYIRYDSFKELCIMLLPNDKLMRN